MKRRYSITFDDHTAEYIKRIAKKEGKTISIVIRELIEEAIRFRMNFKLT